MKNLKKDRVKLGICFMLCGFSSSLIAQTEKTLHWQFDNHGRLIQSSIDNAKVSYPLYSTHGQAKEVLFDGKTLMRTVDFNQDGTPSFIGYSENQQTFANYHYSPFSTPIETRFTVDSVSVFAETAMRFDSRNNLVSLTRQSNQYEREYQYQYDAIGRIKSFMVDNNRVAYGYDHLGNLSSKTGFNRNDYSVTSLPAQHYNEKYQNQNWLYDSDGNVIEDDDYRYQYSDAKRLVLVVDKQTDEWIAHYLYDGNGARVRKMSQHQTTYYYRNFSGQVVLEEVYLNQTGELIASQQHVLHSGIKLATQYWQKDTNRLELEYQFADRLGSQSVRFRDDNNVTTQEYSPFGEQMDKQQIHIGSYGFTQHEDDQKTQSIYMKARHYQPVYGRLNRPDPARDFNIFNASSFNLYAYVGNNPVNTWDPTGLQSALGHYCAQTGNRSSKCQGGTSKETQSAQQSKDDSISGNEDKIFYVGIYGAGKNSTGNRHLENIVEGKNAKLYKANQERKIKKKIKEMTKAGFKVVLLGYSRGGNAAINVANSLGKDNVSLEALVTFDPHSLNSNKTFQLKYDNVKQAYNFYQRNERTAVLYYQQGRILIGEVRLILHTFPCIKPILPI
ncbi:RHS repeat domain-containing protein [Aliikangiella maris]|uniref:RHS repeat-associated core domain-containing protein n=2 Tax=Aliikangiella maris TaxID=3162458 RepID=A0ABV3MSA6_9GAMM